MFVKGNSVLTYIDFVPHFSCSLDGVVFSSQGV